MTTRTLLETPTSSLSLPFDTSDRKERPFSECIEALVELQETCVRYRNWRDPLSLKIFSWVHAANALRNREVNEGLKADVLSRINELREKILVNSLDGAPLKIPVLSRDFNPQYEMENTWVWEKWMLDDYSQIFVELAEDSSADLRVKSPFCDPPPSEPGLLSTEPHPFAQAVIEWSLRFSNLLQSSSPSTRTVGLFGFVQPSRYLNENEFIRRVSKNDRFLMYCLMAQKRFSTLKKARDEQKVKEMAEYYSQQVTVRTEERIQTEAARERKRQEDREASLIQSLAASAANTQQALGALTNQLTDIRGQLHSTQNQLNRAEEQCAQQGETIAVFRGTIQSLEQRLENAPSGGGGGRCTIL